MGGKNIDSKRELLKRIEKIELELAQLKQKVAAMEPNDGQEMPLQMDQKTMQWPAKEQKEKSAEGQPQIQKQELHIKQFESIIWKQILPITAMVLIIVGIAVFAFMSMPYLTDPLKPCVVAVIAALFYGGGFYFKKKERKWVHATLNSIGNVIIYSDIMLMYYAWNLIHWYLAYIMIILFSVFIIGFVWKNLKTEKEISMVSSYIICAALLISVVLVKDKGFLQSLIFFVPAITCLMGVFWIHKKEYGTGNIVFGITGSILFIEAIHLSISPDILTSLYSHDVWDYPIQAWLSSIYVVLLCFYARNYRKIAYNQKYDLAYTITSSIVIFIMPFAIRDGYYGFSLFESMWASAFMIAFYLGNGKNKITYYVGFPLFIFCFSSFGDKCGISAISSVLLLAISLYHVWKTNTIGDKLLSGLVMFIVTFFEPFFSAFRDNRMMISDFCACIMCIVILMVFLNNVRKKKINRIFSIGIVLTSLIISSQLPSIIERTIGRIIYKITETTYDQEITVVGIFVLAVMHLIIFLDKKYGRKCISDIVFAVLVSLKTMEEVCGYEKVLYQLIGCLMLVWSLHIVRIATKQIERKEISSVVNAIVMTGIMMTMLHMTPIWEYHSMVSLFFIIVASVFIYVGINRNRIAMRVYGFVLLFTFAIKLVSYDITGIHPLIRVLACITAGVVCLILAGVYQKKEKIKENK